MKVFLAYLLDLIFGDPEGYPHPVRLIGSLISKEERIIRKYAKNPKALKLAGFFMCFFTTTLAYAVTYISIYLAGFINHYFAYLIEVAFIYTTLATKDLARAAYSVYTPLKKKDLKAARENLALIVSRDTENLEDKDIIRGVLETVSENISDGIIAPMFYAFLGGAPLAMFYKAASTLDSMVGYKNEKYKDLGFASAKLDDLLNFIPARITGLLIVISSFLLGYDYKNSFKIFIRDRLKHESPNSAHGEAALAGALGVELGGLNYYFGKPVIKPKLGDKKEELSLKHINSSVKIMYMTSFIGLIVFYLFEIFFKKLI
ncbi:adenosylcobinamide-phosphate synthase CbiB [Caldanaerobacter sp.]|uniref:adenosylcobinamide-phosphate synthase CbiB n=1 Tax=Caldanaerobacter sp. TaxID=2930036 RepID=UPI003C78288D